MMKPDCDQKNAKIADFAFEVRHLRGLRLVETLEGIEGLHLHGLDIDTAGGWGQVLDTKTGDVLTIGVSPATHNVIQTPDGTETSLWAWARKRSGLDPRPFYIEAAQAAGLEVPEDLAALCAPVEWSEHGGPAPEGWKPPKDDPRWKEADDFIPTKAEWPTKFDLPEGEDFIFSAEDFFPDDKFAPMILARQFVEDYRPRHDGSSFYLYNEDSGTWREIHNSFVGQKLSAYLGDRAKSSWVLDARRMVEFETHFDPNELQPDRHLLNLENGVLDIQTNRRLLHNPDYFFRNQIPLRFNPAATCPKWHQYLAEIFPDDLDRSKTLQDFAGYCLCPTIFIHKCLFLIGHGGNGKSVFLNTLCKLVGHHNVSAIEPFQMADKFLVGTLRNKLLNCCNEIETKSPIHGAALKQVISGDLIQADIKYKTPITFRPTAKHVFSMNALPNLTDRTFGMTRRLIVVRFNRTFDGRTADTRLESKLEAELPGILNWALTGLNRVLQTRQIHETEQMKRDKISATTLLNPVRLFVDESCLLAPTATCKKGDLYRCYVEFCHASNIAPQTKRGFYEQLQTDYPQIDEYRPAGGARHFTGIAPISD